MQDNKQQLFYSNNWYTSGIYSMPINDFRRNTLNKTWDYIIVGAGTAGCVLANTLSDNPAVSVLLI